MNDDNPEDFQATDFDAFDACKVRRKDGMICLTDMWKANGQPENKLPRDWKRLPATIEIAEHLQRYLDKSDVGKSHITSDVIETRRGQRADGDDNGSTWAHWQLAMVYAHYLSPAYYIWCNALVRNATMLSLNHAAIQSGLPFEKVYEDQFDHLHRRFDSLSRHAMDILLLSSTVQQRQDGRRLEFTDRSRSIFCEVIATEPYDGMCPCCTRTVVLAADTNRPLPGAEFDHFYGPSLNRPEHGWLICKQCHRDFTRGSPLLRFSSTTAFHLFRGYVLERLALSSAPALD